MARRRQEEFYCDVGGGGCGKYFLTYLQEEECGNFVIECPGCKHHHYREVREGLVTADRFNKNTVDPIVLMGLFSTLRETPWHEDPAFRRAQMRAYGVG